MPSHLSLQKLNLLRDQSKEISENMSVIEESIQEIRSHPDANMILVSELEEMVGLIRTFLKASHELDVLMRRASLHIVKLDLNTKIEPRTNVL